MKSPSSLIKYWPTSSKVIRAQINTAGAILGLHDVTDIEHGITALIGDTDEPYTLVVKLQVNGLWHVMILFPTDEINYGYAFNLTNVATEYLGCEVLDGWAEVCKERRCA